MKKIPKKAQEYLEEFANSKILPNLQDKWDMLPDDTKNKVNMLLFLYQVGRIDPMEAFIKLLITDIDNQFPPKYPYQEKEEQQ